MSYLHLHSFTGKTACFLIGAWRGRGGTGVGRAGAGGVRVAEREGAGGAGASGQGFEEMLDDRGEGRIALGCPDPRAAVGIVGMVTVMLRMGSPVGEGLLGLYPLSRCAQGRVIFCTTCGGADAFGYAAT